MTTTPFERAANASPVPVPTPAPGDSLSVNMLQNGAVQLSFDPGDANVSRSGNSLVFELDNGGTVTIVDFFVTLEGNELPTLILPGGVEVPAVLAFADTGLDLVTAAGPQAAANVPGSGTNYADDSGTLISGLDKYGMLGTDYWSRSTQYAEEYRSLELPGGDWSLGATTDLGGLFAIVGGVFEDARPFQHNGDWSTFTPAQLTFSFTPTGTTEIDGIRVSGFPAGTVLYFGDPVNPATPTVTVTGPGQVFQFTEQDFANGVYLVPPQDSDSDFSLHVEVDIHAVSSGLTNTLTGSVTVIVDAVADMPDLDAYDATADSSGHFVSHETNEYEYDQGFNRVENNAGEGSVTGKATVTITVQATFGDYTDASEAHYMLIETHPNLVPDQSSLPPGYQYTGTIEIDGVTYHQFQVDNAVIAANNGTVDLPVTFTTTGQAGDKRGEDEKYTLRVGAYAEENSTDSEITFDNNTAHIVSQQGGDPSAIVDVVNSGLTVEIGWASEGNSNSGHTSGSYAPNFAGMDEGDGVAQSSTGSNGAPINISLSGGYQGSAEFITSAELGFDEGRGQLCVNGQPVYDGMSHTDGSGVIYAFSVALDGTVTINITGQTDNLDSLNLTFKPNADYDDTDVSMSYKVTVENSAGAAANYGGSTEIVIDAVADKPVGLGGSTIYDENDPGKTAAEPGDTVELTFTVAFPDTDGSEEHRVFIRMDGNNASATYDAKYDAYIIDATRVAEVNATGGNLGNTPQYLELPIPHPDQFVNGEYTDAQTGLFVLYDAATGIYTFPALDITITTTGNGSYAISGVEVTLPGYDTLTDGIDRNGELDGDGDTHMNFPIIAWAHENGGEKGSSGENNEHDAGNNDAFSDGRATVWIATPGGGNTYSLSGKAGFENDLPYDNRPEILTDPAGSDNDPTADGGIGLSITWALGDAKEIVTDVVITVPLDRYGNPQGEIQYKHSDGTVTTYTADASGVIRIPVDADDQKNGFDSDDLTFVPLGHGSGEVVLDVTVTVEDTRSGATADKDAGQITLAIDAVANRSGEVTGSGSYATGHTAFAPDLGDDILLTAQTTFGDNDGSERHYLLIEQKAGWDTEFDVGYYDLYSNGEKAPYFKIPVPTAPKEGQGTDQSDPHQLTWDEWAVLQQNGEITVDRGGYSITIQLEQTIDADGNLVYDPSLPWTVTAEVSVTPPALAEGDYSLGIGSLAEETHINQSTENRDDEYKANNVAMRPGENLTFTVDYAEGISVTAGFVYENDEQYYGPAYLDKDGNVIDPGYEQNGVISITPSSGADSLYGTVTISIPSGHGTLSYEDAAGNPHNLEPGNSYTYITPDGVSGTLVVSDGGSTVTVTFVPDNQNAHYAGVELGIHVADDYKDTDIPVTVTGGTVNENSGDTKQASGGATITVDAVAQAPDEVVNTVDGATSANVSTGEGAKVTLSATFVDLDGSEDHFFLVEARPGFSYDFTTAAGVTATINLTTGWPTVVGPDGVTYFKIPADPDANGDATLDLEIRVAQNEVVRKNGDSVEATFQYGAMSEEAGVADSEKTYDNNIAFNVENGFTIAVDFGNGPGWRPVEVDTAYENNTANAHKGDDTEAYAKVNLTLPDDADGIWLKPGDRGTLVDKDGNTLPTSNGPDGTPGWYFIPAADSDNVYFKVAEDYSDKNESLAWEVKGGTEDGESGMIDVIVDAVAQPASVANVTVQTDGSYTHAGPGDVVLTVTLADLVDPDYNGAPGGYGLTEYFVLVEALPGWECQNPDAELVVVDGKSYFRVPVDPADINLSSKTAEVEITLTNPGGGDITQNLAVGVEVRDTPGDNGEISLDNNTAITIDGEAQISISVAEDCLVLTVGSGYEDNIGGVAAITVSNLGANDVVTDITLSIEAAEGAFFWSGASLTDGTVFNAGNLHVEVSETGGRLIITVTSNNGKGLTESDLADLNANLALGTIAGNHSDKDIQITWDYTVLDTLSGDTAQGGGTPNVIIDAVAHEPVVSGYSVTYDGGKTGAAPGDTVIASATVAFTNVSAETNYVLVQYAPGWEVNGVTLTGADSTVIHYSAEELAQAELFYPDGSGSGGAYYKLPLTKDGLTIDPGAGGTYNVQVAVDITVPESGFTSDSAAHIGIGGAVVDSFTDGETTLSNNVASEMSVGSGIQIGIADSTGIDAGQNVPAPTEGAGTPITFDIAPDGDNDIITALTLINTHPDPESTGYFYYDGQKLEYDENGAVTLPPTGATPGWEFESDKLAFIPGDIFGGDLKITIDATVADAASGDTKEGVKGDMALSVIPEATAPTNLSAVSMFDATDGGMWTLVLSAAFADIDGSEVHFFTFQVPNGLTLVGDYPGLQGPSVVPGGVGDWYTIAVDPTVSDPSVELSFRADSTWDGTSGVHYTAGATENGATAWAAPPASAAEASPSADGDFAYRTEHVQGSTDFSGESHSLYIYGSDGQDTITGGTGDDTIAGGSGDDVIYANGGNNLIIGGAGNDTMHAGNGEDIFFWNHSHFGTDDSARDIIHNFQYNKDMLLLEEFATELDLSSVSDILDFLNEGKGSFENSTLNLQNGDWSITAEFDTTSLFLTITSGDGIQSIEVNFASSGYELPTDESAAAEIVKNLIEQGNI